MKLLMVHPGASMSTADVYDGLVDALRARDHTLWEYALDGRIELAGAYLDYVWKRSTRNGNKFDKPSTSDILYRAGEELVTRALRVQPDCVFIVSAMYLHPDVLILLRRAGLKVAMLFTESPYDDEKQGRLVPYVDVSWTNERSSAASSYGAVKYLPHAWSPRRLAPNDVGDDLPAHDVVFVGTGFKERIETLEAIDFSGLDVGFYGSWDLMGSRNRLRRFIRGNYIDNRQAMLLYRKAKIGLNLYRQSRGFGKDAPRITHAESLNPRAYELAAAGCVTISDPRDEVAEIFGDLVPTFDDPSQVRPIIDCLLSDRVEMDRIRVGLPLAVRAHTWHTRAEQVEADLRDAGIGARHVHQPTADAGTEARTATGG